MVGLTKITNPPLFPFTQFRLKRVLPGPNLPTGISFPCLLSLNENLTFVIGAPYPEIVSNWNDILPEVIFLFNHINETWTHLRGNFSCPLLTKQKFSCAYLSHENLVIAGYGKCLATLNMTSLTWTSMDMKHGSGLVLNIDSARKSVIYIGTDLTFKGSSVYMVGLLSCRLVNDVNESHNFLC